MIAEARPGLIFPVQPETSRRKLTALPTNPNLPPKSGVIEVRPTEPVEPTPFSLSEIEWKRYIKQRDAARKYAAENDLAGVPYD